MLSTFAKHSVARVGSTASQTLRTGMAGSAIMALRRNRSTAAQTAPTNEEGLRLTPINQIPEIVAKTRGTFKTGKTIPVEYRKEQLKAAYAWISDNEDLWLEALKHDLGKSKSEGVMLETGMVMSEAAYLYKNVHRLVKGTKVNPGIVFAAYSTQIKPDPYGNVLVIGAWNYPVQLTAIPLIGAIAAGNTAIIKPSEVSEAVAQTFEDTMHRYLDSDAYSIVQADAEGTSALLKEKWDFIAYTGNGTVGRIVQRAAAENLTPTLLELGGKSPTIIDRGANLKNAARRITMGRWFNAGQTCIACDYVLCPRDMQEELAAELKNAITVFYTEDPGSSGDYGRIATNRHFERQVRMIEGQKQDVVLGGEYRATDRYVAPTVMAHVDPASEVMQDEIFGPILPMIDCESIDEAITFINDRDKPLALYIFSGNKVNIQQVLDYTSSGGAVVNDTLIHAAIKELPFGGVGPSGVGGGYHGDHSFNVFSHQKAVAARSEGGEWLTNTRYPPLINSTLDWVRKAAHVHL
eukprot:Clim_evm15s224 gene=Clim_evmTU15s224